MDERRTPPPQVQQPLPFDDESDRPVPYSLTARARREVAPEALPDLAIVTKARMPRGHAPAGHSIDADTEDGALDAPGDTRPSRARALRRAGLSVDAITRQLDVDELAVRAWLGGLVGHTTPTTASPRTTAPPRTMAPARDADAGDGARAHDRARERARAEALGRWSPDATFAAGLGLMVGVADLDAHSVAVTTRDPRLATVMVAWLMSHTAAPRHRFRVVLRLGRSVAADVARHRWAEALGIGVGQITHTRVSGVTEHDEEALLRLADPSVAGTVAGWADTLLDPPSPTPADAAF